MSSPADMRPLQYGVTCAHGPVHLCDAEDDPHWGTRQQAQWTITALRAQHPDVEYRIITRSTP